MIVLFSVSAAVLSKVQQLHTSSGLGSGSTSRTSILYWTSEQEQHYDILIDTDSDSEFNYKRGKGPGNLGINS